MQPIPLEVLTSARPCLIENAKALLEDSLYLLNDSRFSRSYALAVLAREELGKLAIVVRTVYRLRASETVDWERYKKRTNDHFHKLKISAFVQTIYSSNLVGSADVKADLLKLGRHPSLSQWLDEKKQDGLHVRITSKGIETPLATIGEADARSLYDSTRILLEYFDSGEFYDPADTVLFGIVDYYGKVIALADDLCEAPDSVSLPR